MELYIHPNSKKSLKLCISTINETYHEDIYSIDFFTIPTPTRLMGKNKEIINNWRICMNNKQKNKLLQNSDLYNDIIF